MLTGPKIDLCATFQARVNWSSRGVGAVRYLLKVEVDRLDSDEKKERISFMVIVIYYVGICNYKFESHKK